jgi:hypothetical protein
MRSLKGWRMEDFKIIDELELLVVFLCEFVAWMFMMLMTRPKMSLRLIHLPRAKRPLFSLKSQSFKIIRPNFLLTLLLDLLSHLCHAERARPEGRLASRLMILVPLLGKSLHWLPPPISGPQMSLPKLELPTFKGEKGAKAQIWLESLGRFQKFYRLTDEQAVELARFSCKGFYAKTWAGLLPDDLTFATFKEHFKAEFAVENLDKLMSELLLKTQKGEVGEYATEMMEYFKMLQLDEAAKIRHFVRGLKFGIKETVMASGPTTLLLAIRKAKEAETAYELSGKNRGPLDGINREVTRKVQRQVQDEMNLLRRRHGNDRLFDTAFPNNVFRMRDQGRDRGRDDRGRSPAREREVRERRRDSPVRRESPRPRTRSPAAARARSPIRRDPAPRNQLGRPLPPPPNFPGRCPRCLQRGHGVVTCPNPAAVPRNDCCGLYGSHYRGCQNAPTNQTNTGRQQGQAHIFQVLGLPIGPAHVEIQSKWQEDALYPPSVCSLEVNVPVQTVPPLAHAEPPAKESKKKTSEAEKDQEPLNDAFSDDSDDDQAYTSSDEEGEVYVKGKLGKRRKVAAREELPRGREPVTNPPTLEERMRRKETRLSNRQQTRKNNLRMIRLLMRGVAEKLHSHRHIKHFKSDLHRYIESLFDD